MVAAILSDKYNSNSQSTKEDLIHVRVKILNEINSKSQCVMQTINEKWRVVCLVQECN